MIEDVATTANMRISLDVGVYFVDSDKADEFGVGIAADGSIGEFGATVVAAATGEAAGGFVISRGADSISFLALAQDSAVIDYRLASSVAQSGVITPIALTSKSSYIRNITRERGDEENPGTTTYEIADLETGLSIAALPRLVEGRHIHLALTISQRTLVRFDEPLLDVALKLPEVDNREIRNETVLAPGETLALSGYEQDVVVRADRGVGFLRRLGIGGGTEASVRKVRMVIFVRPTLIPSRGRGGRS